MSAAKSLEGSFRAGSEHWVGDGFPVRNLFPSNPLNEAISPYLLLDYAGPREFEPRADPRGVGEHPHRGFETVTVVYQGEIEHRDSAGAAGKLEPGDVQWMTAGDGVVHEERFSRAFAASGGTLEMVQLWVNLPSREKRTKPRYQDIPAARIPSVELGPGASARVVAGELSGVRGPALSFSPVYLYDLTLDAGASCTVEVPDGFSAALAVLEGEVEVAGVVHGEASLALYSRDGRNAELSANARSRGLLIGGQPLGEPVVSHGPFVMNTEEEILEAVRDYQAGRMGHLDGD